MSLENLKVEINKEYINDFKSLFPSKKYGCNNVDIYSIHNVIIKPKERKLVPLEFKILVDDNHVFMINHNERTATINGITVIQKVISSKDKDLIVICVWNTTDMLYTINKGDVIANGYLLASPILYDIQEIKNL